MLFGFGGFVLLFWAQSECICISLTYNTYEVPDDQMHAVEVWKQKKINDLVFSD